MNMKHTTHYNTLTQITNKANLMGIIAESPKTRTIFPSGDNLFGHAVSTSGIASLWRPKKILIEAILMQLPFTVYQ